jgi:hypothetical protein
LLHFLSFPFFHKLFIEAPLFLIYNDFHSDSAAFLVSTWKKEHFFQTRINSFQLSAGISLDGPLILSNPPWRAQAGRKKVSGLDSLQMSPSGKSEGEPMKGGTPFTAYPVVKVLVIPHAQIAAALELE